MATTSSTQNLTDRVEGHSEEEEPSMFDCFFKKVQVCGEVFQASVALWSSTACLAVAVVLYVVGFSTVGWARVYNEDPDEGEITRMLGLWQLCQSREGCSYLTPASASAAMRACQAFAVIALICLALALVILLLYVFFVNLGRPPSVGTAVLMLRSAACVSLFLLIVVYANTWDRPRFVSPAYHKGLEYSFSLTVVAFVMDCIGTILFAMDICTCGGGDTKTPELVDDDPYIYRGSDTRAAWEDYEGTLYSTAEEEAFHDIEKLRLAIGKSRASYASSTEDNSQFNPSAPGPNGPAGPAGQYGQTVPVVRVGNAGHNVRATQADQGGQVHQIKQDEWKGARPKTPRQSYTSDPNFRHVEVHHHPIPNEYVVPREQYKRPDTNPGQRTTDNGPQQRKNESTVIQQNEQAPVAPVRKKKSQSAAQQQHYVQPNNTTRTSDPGNRSSENIPKTANLQYGSARPYLSQTVQNKANMDQEVNVPMTSDPMYTEQRRVQPQHRAQPVYRHQQGNDTSGTGHTSSSSHQNGPALYQSSTAV